MLHLSSIINLIIGLGVVNARSNIWSKQYTHISIEHIWHQRWKHKLT